MKKLLVVFSVILVVGVLGWTILSGGDKQVVTDSNQAKINQRTEVVDEDKKPISTAPDLVLGSSTAPITITEYADFKCPTCNKFTRSSYIELKQAYLDIGKAKIVFRNLPFIAADSKTAAEGAYCANSQGKFSAYHDLLYNHIWDEYYSKGKIQEGEFGEVFTAPQLAKLVESIGIDVSKFTQCLDTGEFKDAVTSDLGLSEKDGATGTPTFIIGGQKIVGAQPFGIFDKLIKAQQ